MSGIMKSPRLSIIVPVYNTQEYLVKCLDSLVNQTFRGLEVICVNDGSTDGSLSVLEDYAANHVNIRIINQSNMGPSAARNAGLRAATGEYITFVDSDDSMDTNAYKFIFEKMGRAQADAVCFGLRIVGDSFYHIRGSEDDYYRLRLDGIYEITDEIILSTNVSVCNKLFKRRIIIANDITFPNGYHYEDYLFFWMYMMTSNNVFFIKEKLYNYTRRDGSIMTKTFNRFSDKAIDHLILSRKLYDYMRSMNLLPQKMEIFLLTFISNFWFSYAHSPKKLRNNVLKTATILIHEMNLNPEMFDSMEVLVMLKFRKYHKIPRVEYVTFIQKIFSIRDGCNHKVIRLLGWKISVRK